MMALILSAFYGYRTLTASECRNLLLQNHQVCNVKCNCTRFNFFFVSYHLSYHYETYHYVIRFIIY